jgi:type II secretory pathway pseudopilin PulG
MMKREQLENINTNNERGFSLIELSVAVLLTVGLMAVVFSLMSQNQQIFARESNVTDLNQNIRSVVDLLTQDIQSAGMGLPRSKGSFASIFYTNGTSTTADKLMIVNGNPWAPTAGISLYDDSNPADRKLFCTAPVGVTADGSGLLSYMEKGVAKPIYRASSTVYYICYDDSKVRRFTLSNNGTIAGGILTLRYTSSSWVNTPSTFGSPVDTGEPDRDGGSISLLANLISYRVNATTRELERTEDLVNYEPVARGILNIQFRFRTIAVTGGVIDEVTVDAPTDRDNIRSVIVTITAETPDYLPGDKNYRLVTHRFEVAPRNFNLIGNTNLSSNLN